MRLIDLFTLHDFALINIDVSLWVMKGRLRKKRRVL